VPEYRDGSTGPAPAREIFVSVQSVAIDPLQGRKPASDGLESDAEGHAYTTAYAQNGIVRRKPDDIYGTIVHDPRALWPDTISMA
jgi:hypothetical protein